MQRLALVSGHAHVPFTPRGARTRVLARALESRWSVEVIGPAGEPATHAPAGHRDRSPGLWPALGGMARGAARALAECALLDKWEPWALQTVGPRWRPAADGALLVAYPFSPAVHAARVLERTGIPYVVDAGDPWILTSQSPSLREPALSRGRRAERRLWSGAAGAVLTTDAQAAGLRAVAPGLPILVAPNGYPEQPDRPREEHPPAGRHLRLAHFGMLSSARLDLAPLLADLVGSGAFERVTFAQFGDDYAGMLDAAPAGVDVERHPARPWNEVIDQATAYDAAVVVGNHSGSQLPSKAVQYLTLPVPRIAIVNGAPDDALTDFAQRTPGWVSVAPGDREAPAAIRRHLARPWTPADLAPPHEFGWPAVARRVSEFMNARLGDSRTETHP